MTFLRKCFLSACQTYTVFDDAFPVCLRDVIGRPARIPTCHACSGEIGGEEKERLWRQDSSLKECIMSRNSPVGKGLISLVYKAVMSDKAVVPDWNR